MTQRWLTILGATERLTESGYPYSPNTVRSWIRRGHLPIHRRWYEGRLRVVILEADLMAAEQAVHARTKPAQRVPLADSSRVLHNPTNGTTYAHSEVLRAG